MSTLGIQVLGTGSHSGKSVIAAGLCRILRRRGLRVAPFKAQNMALNSAATPCGGEIGRAQAVQARAADLEPRVDMNPILLKPTGGHRSQVILQGKSIGTMSAREYYRRRDFFLNEALRSYRRLAQEFEVIVLEGAGSPVEMNLLDRDIVNLPFARLVDARAVLVADIDRGGIFAALVGTHQLLDDDGRGRIRSFLVNKFHGQVGLFADGVEMLEARTQWPCLGVVPFVDWLALEEEDSVALEGKTHGGSGQLRIAVLRLPHLSNYSDFDPLEACNARLIYARSVREILSADLVILPGSKSTIADLLWMRAHGLDQAVLEAHQRGAVVLGTCGGYQMLGSEIRDPKREESDRERVRGLNLLPMKTVLLGEKTTVEAQGETVRGAVPVWGYEIHLGRSRFHGPVEPLLRLSMRGGQPTSQAEGAQSGRTFGTYLHGLFEQPEFTDWFLSRTAELCGLEGYQAKPAFSREAVQERWADLLEERLDRQLLEELLR